LGPFENITFFPPNPLTITAKTTIKQWMGERGRTMMVAAKRNNNMHDNTKVDFEGCHILTGANTQV